MDTLLNLTYFKAPISHTLPYPDASIETRECDYCDEKKDFCYCSDESTFESKPFWSKDSGTKSELWGCIDCLVDRRFSIEKETEIGDVVKGKISDGVIPDGFDPLALVEIGYTPPVATMQYSRHLCHCNDFMVYIGRWEQADFNNHAVDGDGKALWMRSVSSNQNFLWDRTNEDRLEAGDEWPYYDRSEWSFGSLVYVFQCRHCNELSCFWDAD